MAGYSGTPLPKKLGIKDGSRVRVLGGPAGFARELGVERKASSAVERKAGSAIDPKARGEFDVIVFFASSAKELAKGFGRARKSLHRDGGLWIAWPKKASGVATDLSEGLVREAGLSLGLVDNKVCAIDDTWSGLRFCVRLADR